MTMWSAQTAATIDQIKEFTGARDREFEVDNRLLAAAARGLRAADYAMSRERWNIHTRALAAFHERFDLLLTPTLARPPVRVGELATPPLLRLGGELLLRLRLTGIATKTKLWNDQILANLAPVPFTQLANITGRPAMSVPLHRTASGLPLGVQFVGGLGSEPTLLALATQLEAEHPWAQDEPVL
jgi:amidase